LFLHFVVIMAIGFSSSVIVVPIVSGVARPQATLAMAWGVPPNSFVNCSYSNYYLTLFCTVA
jgi:hypothetical protein